MKTLKLTQKEVKHLKASLKSNILLGFEMDLAESILDKLQEQFISTKINLKKMDNQTKFYTEGFGKVIAAMDGIIFLNKGDVFLGENGEHYTIVWKVYNPFLNIMIYHGKLTTEALM